MLATSEFQNLVRRAEGGDVEAQYSLAELYHRGDGVLRNYVEAEKWYLRSAEQGCPGAQFYLGLLYLEGLGNRAEGMRLLALVGKRGDECACYELGKALSEPSGQGRDPVAAYIWFCLAGAYGRVCDKEIQKLESELSTEQVLGAQVRAGEEFRPLVVRAAAEEAEARRAAEEAAAQEAEARRFASQVPRTSRSAEMIEEARRRLRDAGLMGS